jgi:uncharacterized protein YuzE
MRFEYDGETDIGYIELDERDSSASVVRELLPWLHADLDGAGHLIGLEVHAASRHLSLDAIRPRVDLLGTKEAAALLGVKVPNFIRDWAARPDFPKPLASLASTRVWDRAAVVAYLARHGVATGAL